MWIVRHSWPVTLCLLAEEVMVHDAFYASDLWDTCEKFSSVLQIAK